MATKNDPAEILAFANVQHAIGNLIQAVARESGIADKHASRMRIQIIDRLSSGSPVDAATDLVTAILDAQAPAIVDKSTPLSQGAQAKSATPAAPAPNKGQAK